MIYKSQIICIIMILFIAFFHIVYAENKTLAAKRFTKLLIVSEIQLVFDICSVYTVNHVDTVSPLLNRMVHCLYMSFMIFIFIVGYKYLEALIEEEKGEKIFRVKGLYIPLVLAVLALCFLPIQYIETSKGNYSYGLPIFVVYGCIVVYMLLIVRLLIKHGKDIQPRKRKAVTFAMLSEVPIAIFQMFVPTSLISCLAITLIILGLYMTVENNDARLVKLLEKETKRADIANQAKTNFLANMSHEIRTPINAVLGMNEMILRESKEKNVREYSRDVQGAAKSLLSIINDILDITKIEAGKLQIVPVEYDFATMIRDVSNMISFKARAKDLDFEIKIDENIPREFVGDDIRIRQILVNILNNAVKYTHQGKVTLEVKLLPEEAKEQAAILFCVKDTGIGIKKEDIDKLFIPFERIEEKRNRNIEGTGLGMNITMQLLELLNSKLEVVSEYGKGSEFSFILCQEIVNKEPIGDLREQVEDKAEYESYATAYEAPDAKILVVDDNEMNRKVFCNLLKDTKMQIHQAESGRKCLELVKNNQYDIIFMDHMMPEMDGIETLHNMKKMEECLCKETPVVILTANAIVGAKEQYLKEGFCAFLTKPIDTQKLENLIKELLGEERICYVERREKSPSLDVDELPMIDGVDWGYAIIHHKDKEAMLDVVRMFMVSLEYEAKELEKYYADLETDEGIKLYRIKVHSMKSSAAMAGLIALSGMAYVLEKAAGNHDRETILRLHSVFLREWLLYKERLSILCEKKTGKENAREHQKEIDELFTNIKNAAVEMNIDVMDAAVERLKEFQFDTELQTKVQEIEVAVANLDVEYLESII